MRRVGALALLAAASLPSQAHSAFKGSGQFYSGLLHPYTSPAHLLALLVLGLLLGQRGFQASRHALVALPVALVIGLAASGLAGGFDGDVVLLAGAATIGLVVVTAPRLPPLGLVILTAPVGLLVGLGSSPDTLVGMPRAAALAGTWLGASLCCGYPAAMVQAGQQAWLKIGVRVVASWITASALLVLTLAIFKR